MDDSSYESGDNSGSDDYNDSNDSDDYSDDDSDDLYHYHDVESEVAQIKDWYYNPTSEVSKVSKTGGSSGLRREYYYHNGELFFVFMFNDDETHRLYFNNGELIRYIDPYKNVYDYDDCGGNVPAPAYIFVLISDEC